MHQPELQSGAAISTGVSPQSLVRQRKSATQSQASDIAKATIESSIKQSMETFHISETSVVKLCISRAKRDNLDLSQLIDSEMFNAVESFITEAHTTSIKKLLQHNENHFTEGQIRLTRYLLQQQESDTWDY